MAFIDSLNLEIRSALASSISDPEVPKLSSGFVLFISRLCFPLQCLFFQTQWQQTCLWLQVYIFFFLSQSHQEKENVPFLTENSNRSLRMGTHGLCGIPELTTDWPNLFYLWNCCCCWNPQHKKWRKVKER